LRDELCKLKDDLGATRRQLDTAKTVSKCCCFGHIFTLLFAPAPSQTSSSGGGSTLSEAERREKKVLEKKLSEMEEELKVRGENGQGIRYMGKRSSSSVGGVK